MEQWKEYRLGEIAEMKYGKLPNKFAEYKGQIPIWSGYRVVGYTNSINCKKGTAIVVARGVGGTGDVKIAKEDCFLTNLSISITLNEGICKPLYFYYKYQTKNLKYLDSGSAQSQITIEDLKRLQLNIPPISYQNKVIELLSPFYDKIELNRKINSNLEEQAKALFKSWFIDFEPFKDGKFIDSELGKIPEGWKVVTIGEVTDNIKEKVCDRDSIKVLSPVTSGHLVLSEEYFSKQVFSSSIAKYIVVKHNDFAYNPARINIGSIGMNEFEFDGCVSPVYVVFRCQSGYEYFFDLYRRTSYFIEEVKKRAIGGVRQTLSYKDLSLIQLIYPPKKVVDAFNFIYISFIHEIHSNDVSNKKLEAIRDALLPKLMSGEIDVR